MFEIDRAFRCSIKCHLVVSKVVLHTWMHACVRACAVPHFHCTVVEIIVGVTGEEKTKVIESETASAVDEVRGVKLSAGGCERWLFRSGRFISEFLNGRVKVGDFPRKSFKFRKNACREWNRRYHVFERYRSRRVVKCRDLTETFGHFPGAEPLRKCSEGNAVENPGKRTPIA